MQTSASMTNSRVSISSLADKPKRMRGCEAAVMAGGSILSRVDANLVLSPAKPSDDASHRRVCRRRGEERHRGAFIDLTEGRIGRHHLGHGADIEALVDGERPRRNQFSGVRPHDGSAEYAASSGGHHLD